MCQANVHLRDAFRKSCRILRDLRDRQQIRIRMNRRRGWNIELRRQDAVLNDGIVSHHATALNRAVEDHGIESDEYLVSHGAGTVNDRAMGD